MNKKIYIYIVGLILMGLVLPLIFAETETKPVNQDVILTFTCTLNNEIPASAQMNITVNYPNGSTFINNQNTTSLGNGAFSYPANFPILGTYNVQKFCWDGTYSNSDSDDNYLINTSGNNYGWIILLFLFGLGIIFLFFSIIADEEFLIYVSGILFLIAGIYVMINGLEYQNDWYTRVISYISLGLGFLFTIGAYLFNKFTLRGESSDEVNEEEY